MRTTWRWWAPAALLFACTPSTNVPGTNLFLEAEDGKYHGPMVSIAIEPSEATFEVAQTTKFSAKGTFEDGTVIDITEHVYFQLEGAGATLAPRDGGTVSVTGVAVGNLSLQIILGTLNGAAQITIIPAHLERIELVGDTTEVDGKRQRSIRFSLIGHYADGTQQDQTEAATWTSSDVQILEFQSPGLARALRQGEVSVTASFEDQSASVNVLATCYYPTAPANETPWEIYPDLSWNAYRPFEDEPFHLSMKDIYCDDDTYGNVKIIVFNHSAQWCGPCHQMLNYLDPLIPRLEAQGALFIHGILQDMRGRPLSSEGAYQHLDPNRDHRWNVENRQYIANGIRLGDGDTMPRAGLLNSGIVAASNAFPTPMAIRREDMRVIFFEGGFTPAYDYAGMIDRPYDDWRTGVSSPAQTRFTKNCQDADEEAGEPNNYATESVVIDGNVTIEGGICDIHPDFYTVNLEGDWIARLSFDNEVADLDLVVWDDFRQWPRPLAGGYEGSTGTGPEEVYRGSGPSTIRIAPKRVGSAKYTLTIEN